MPGQHSNPTIAFRPTQWERAMIEARVKASGLYKKDFIARSCIYSNIVVVGTKQRVQYLVEELRETQIVMKEITEQILSGDFSIDVYKRQVLSHAFSFHYESWMPYPDQKDSSAA